MGLSLIETLDPLPSTLRCTTQQRQAMGRSMALNVALCAQVRWRRVVLDEAHSIKDRRCSTARAVFALNSKYKWALSGTPLQV